MRKNSISENTEFYSRRSDFILNKLAPLLESLYPPITAITYVGSKNLDETIVIEDRYGTVLRLNINDISLEDLAIKVIKAFKIFK